MGKWIALLVLVMSAQTTQANLCSDTLIKPKTAYGQLRSDFVHSDHYDVEIKSPFGVKNQCATPFCHLYAWTADIENPGQIETSTEYVGAAYLLQSAIKALAAGDAHFASKLGSNPLNSIEIIRAVGLVPKDVWKGVKDFNMSVPFSRITEALQNIIANAVSQRAIEKDPAKQIEINWIAHEQIVEVIRGLVGELPTSFEYQGEVHTPLSFAEKYFPELQRPIISLNAAPIKNASTVGESTDKGLFIAADVETLERTARAVLDSGQPIWLSYQHRRQFVDDKTGIMTVDGFNYPELAQPTPRTTRLKLNMWEGAHAVLLVGYELDPQTGKVRKWKIQNSWGGKIGDQGVFHMYADYFENFALGVTYLDDGKVPIPKHFLVQAGRGMDAPEPKNLLK
jgi:bleomycin hydrolase